MGINRSLSRSSAAPAAGGGAYQTGAQVASNSVRGQSGAGAWTPTVTHLFILIILEIAAFAALRYAFGIVSRTV